MSFRFDKSGDVVIDGFEKGIADSPELGIASIQGANITSVPGEASVSFALASATLPPTGLSSVGYSAVASTGIVTVGTTANYYPGMAIEILTTSLTPTLSYLLVAGGAGGGFTNLVSNQAGGGGAGGLKTGTQAAAIASYPIVIGNGGAGSASQNISGGDGQNSTFNGITSPGGGGGGSTNTNSGNGDNGASGGGGTSGGGTGGTGTGGEGHNGGNGAAGNGNGGGGGGSGGVGQPGSGTSAGGVGTSSSITGSPVTYATGGTATGSVAGPANTGNGGGNGANGGSGVFIISYPTGSLTATGGSMTSSGGNTIHTFNSNGTFAITAINPIVGNVYYVGNITGTTFKIYNDVTLNSLATIVGDFSGNLSVPSFGTPQWSAYYQYYASGTSTAILCTFFIDNPGNCWYLTSSASTGTGGTIAANSLQYTGNVGHAATATNADFGVVAWQGYLFTIVGRTIDYIALSNLLGTAGPNGNWVYAWKTNLTYTQYQHQAIPATDGAIYICNGNTVASILAVGTFDPTNSATYTYTPTALTLPNYDYAQSLAQLGTSLLVGGISFYIYPWDRISTSFSYPLICADANIVRIVSTNSNAYVFAGSRGRIYITNGSQIQIFKKIPDSLTGNPEPYYTWQDALYTRNKLYFTLTATNNAGSALTTMGGIWVLGLDPGQLPTQLTTAGSLFNQNQFSYGTYGGSCPVLFYSQLASPVGQGIGGAWVNAGVNGIDVGASTPYTNYQTIIQTDIIPIGTFYHPTSNSQVEYKISKPLVAGESVRISWRGNLTDSFTAFFTSTITGQVSDATSSVPFEKQQWVQFQIELSSTASSPSYVRFRELRLR